MIVSERRDADAGQPQEGGQAVPLRLAAAEPHAALDERARRAHQVVLLRGALLQPQRVQRMRKLFNSAITDAVELCLRRCVSRLEWREERRIFRAKVAAGRFLPPVPASSRAVWKSTSELGYRRVDGAGRLIYDFHTGRGQLPTLYTTC